MVIAIIALLIAMLMPSLEAARRQAKMSACLSHIKNIASTSQVYEADDPQGWGIPVHPAQFLQDPNKPTYIGAYEWGGKSGIGRADFLGPPNPLNSKYGTKAGFGPATRPLNSILYKGGFTDFNSPYDRIGAQRDTELDLGLFRCPGDDGPPRGGHCTDWVAHPDQSSYDHFGNSFAANVFMVMSGRQPMKSNSPYLRPITRVPTPARTLYYEENIGRWAWAARREQCADNELIKLGVDPGPTKVIRGWHGRDWTYNRSFVDAHAEPQRIIIEGTEDREGYSLHYVAEQLSNYPSWDSDDNGRGDYPGSYEVYHCVIVRGPGWAKDTLPADPINTGLRHSGVGRPSYEDCVAQTD